MSNDRPPQLTSTKLIRILEKLGFQPKPGRGTSHRRYVHSDGRKTTVPVHKNQDIGRGLLRKIIKDIEMTPREFIDFLNKS